MDCEVVHHHCQQYQDVCNVMVLQSYDHVDPNQIREQEMLLEIDDLELLHYYLDCYIVEHQRLHHDQQ